MIRFRELIPNRVLIEGKAVDLKRFDLGIEDLELLKRYAHGDVNRNLDVLIDFYYSADEADEKWFHNEWFPNLNKAGNHVLKLLNEKVYVDVASTLGANFGYRDVPVKVKDWFPFLIYIAGEYNDRDSVGLRVHYNGKIEIFEGNEEASDETYALVNKITGNDKDVIVYGSHGSKVIDWIERNKKLPKSLYVSLDKRRAAGYWGEDRQLFQAKINSSALRKESDVDWKVIEDTPVKSFKLL